MNGLGLNLGLQRFRLGAKLNYLSVLKDGNTVAWYDYTAIDTITKDGSNYVSRWNDRLGSGRDLIQATSTNQPLLNANGVLFDGVDNFMKTNTFTLNQPVKLYIVLRLLTYSIYDYVFDGNTTNSMRAIKTGSPTQVSFDINNTSPYIKANIGTLNTFCILVATYDTTQSAVRVGDLIITGGVSLNVPSGFTLSRAGNTNNGYSNDEFKEIIIRNIADSETNETAIYNYLKTKYSL